MLSLVGALNAALSTAFGWAWLPLGLLGDTGALVVLAGVTGVVVLWVYRRISEPAAIRRHKRRVTGGLLGVRLFRDDLRVVARLQGRILAAIVAYARSSLAPVAVLVVPIGLLAIQLEARLGARPLAVGETALLEVTVAPGVSLASVSVAEGEGVALETAAIRLPADHRIVWRLRATRRGVHEVAVNAGGVILSKQVVVDTAAVVSTTRSRGPWQALLHPAEAPLPDGPVRVIQVGYGTREVAIPGGHAHWLVPFLVVSLGVGVALKRRFGVEL